MKWLDIDTLGFTSGRRLNANCGIIGLSFNNNKFELSVGYDAPIYWPPLYSKAGIEPDDLRTEDMIELADMMIERWQKFRATL